MRMLRCKSAFIYVYLRFYFFMDIPMIFELHYSSFLAGFSDIVIFVKDTIAEGDKVVASWICHGIHTGELQGIAPTGKEVTWTRIAIYRFVGGKIEEVWVWNDIWGMMRRLGVIPVSYTHLRAHETRHDIVCRLL